MTAIGQNAIRWSWARDLIAPAGQIAMFAICLYAYVEAVPTLLAPLHVDFWLLLGLPLLAAWGARLTALLPWRHWVNRALLIPLTAVALLTWLFLVLTPSTPLTAEAWLSAAFAPWSYDDALNGAHLLSAWALALTFWAFGLAVGVFAPDARITSQWFTIGSGGFLMLFLLVAPAPEAAPELNDELQQLLVLYLGLSLMVLGSLHKQSVNLRTGAGRMTPSWFLALAIPVALILSAGLFFTDKLSPAVRWTLETATQFVVAIFSVVFWLVAWALHILFVFHVWFMALFPPATDYVPPQPLEAPRLVMREAIMRSDEPIVPAVYVAIALTALVLGGLVFVLLRLMFRRRKPDMDDLAIDERESIWSWALLRAQLRALWRSIVAALRPQGSPGERLLSRADSPVAADGHDIRALYRRFLADMTARGYRREPATTPSEFSSLLGARLPDDAAAIETITMAYSVARYGEIEPAPSIVETVAGSVDSLGRRHPS